MPTTKTLWNNFLFSISKRVTVHSYDTWFRPIQPHSHDEQTLKVSVPNDYFRRALLEGYSTEIREALRDISLDDTSLSFVLDDKETHQVEVQTAHATTLSNPTTEDLQKNLNSKYTFETFVIGTSNQFANAASHAVAERPAKAYNPLFIYGGVGLGKTHLMHAIGHYILARNRRLRVTYLSSEKFTNDLINAIRYDRTLRFREVYRNIDVLLMDDIQFLAGKERTQEEFFHTFNTLYDAQKQIVITSDCPPKEIPTLEERLHSRFEWGLIADIQPPDLETKIAILKKKAAGENTSLPDNVAFFIAKNIKSNIRELEGSLIRLIAYASLTGTEIDLALAQQVLASLATEEKRILTPDIILKTVAHHFKTKPSTLKSKSNARCVTEPRQVAMYLCKELIDISLPSIGKAFGGKHHTTVLHSIRKVASQRQRDRDLDSLLQKIVSLLQ